MGKKSKRQRPAKPGAIAKLVSDTKEALTPKGPDAPEVSRSRRWWPGIVVLFCLLLWGCPPPEQLEGRDESREEAPTFRCPRDHYEICVVKGGYFAESYCVQSHSVTVSSGEMCLFAKAGGADDALVMCNGQRHMTVSPGKCPGD
jgi:hypothetical protein